MEEALATARQVVASAQALHRDLGGRLSDAAYEAALATELEGLGFQVQRARPLALRFEGQDLDFGLVADLLVEGTVVVRLGSLALFDPGQERLVLDRMDLAGPRVGVYLDFCGRALDHLVVTAGT